MTFKNSSNLVLLKEMLIGFCLGTANIIPGVSGGTFLLIFNIYERVFAILDQINKTNVIFILSCVARIVFKPDRRSSVRDLTEFLIKHDFFFLIKLMTGAVIAIITLSSLMKYLLTHHFSPTYSLFFGLILVSIIIPVNMLKKKKLSLLIFAFLGAVATIYVTYAVNPYEKAKKKSDHYKIQYEQNQEINRPRADHDTRTDMTSDQSTAWKGSYTAPEFLYAFFCGAVAVSAMVLPGISGSLVLILMGEYFVVIKAISGLKTLDPGHMIFLGCFGLGIAAGGLLFAKFINLVLSRYYDPTMAFLSGLMAGSLYALWPFKKAIVMAREYVKEGNMITVAENVRIYTNINELPSAGMPLLIAAAAFLAGCAVMFLFIKQEAGH